ncbi:MAG: CYTH domain-containing protein [Desulfuromonadales bacterium]|nr:CYTH domain-containing protein [Desulfuromonadales bacterium]
MGVEIERKFLVKGKPWASLQGTHYRQGYLTTDPQRTVRVRIAGDRGLLTIKGESRGASRSEFEYPIPLTDAEQMLDELCSQPQIEKVRYCLEHAGLTWEIDVFRGDNAGLVIAEIELDDDDQQVELPPWVGHEVTDDSRFYNASLAEHPLATWPVGSLP